MKNIAFYFFLLCVAALPVAAQNAVKPESFASKATAQSADTLLMGRYTVLLWGITPADVEGTPLLVRARATLDDVIAGQPVSCNVISWETETKATAICNNSKGVDLGRTLIERGYALTQREAITNTVFEEPYLSAENGARSRSAGVWGLRETKPEIDTFLGLPFSKAMTYMSIALGAALLMCLAVAGWLAHLVFQSRKMIKSTIADAEAKENAVRIREKYVMARLIEGELKSNREKVEAFMMVNKDVLETLKNAKIKGRPHKYMQGGEIVQSRPALNRSIFDGNTDKVELLGAQIASNLVDIYSDIVTEAEYLTLEKDWPIDEAVAKVQRIVREADTLLKPLDTLLNAVQIILRDQAKKHKAIRNQRR